MHGGNIKEVDPADAPLPTNNNEDANGQVLGKMTGVETSSNHCSGVEMMGRWVQFYVSAMQFVPCVQPCVEQSDGTLSYCV